MTMCAAVRSGTVVCMKISIKPPTLPTVDTVRTPAAPLSVPVPVPNLGSTFTPAGDERRFSVRFTNSLPQKLQLASVPGELATRLTDRFGAMNRSELDRFGRVAEQLFSGPRPAQTLGLFEAFSSMQTAILRGGHRVEPNPEGSWTITPKGGEAFTLPDVAGSKAKLADGTPVGVDTKGLFRSGQDFLHRGTAELAQRLPPEQLMSASLALLGLNPAVQVAAAALTVVQNSPHLMRATALMLDACGAHDAADSVRGGAGQLEKSLADVQPAVCVGVQICAAMTNLVSGRLTPFEQAGRSAAPSPRADADLERGMLFLRVAAGATSTELSDFASSIRGKSRDALHQLR